MMKKGKIMTQINKNMLVLTFPDLNPNPLFSPLILSKSSQWLGYVGQQEVLPWHSAEESLEKKSEDAEGLCTNGKTIMKMRAANKTLIRHGGDKQPQVTFIFYGFQSADGLGIKLNPSTAMHSWI
jgi:hypothetical protein